MNRLPELSTGQFQFNRFESTSGTIKKRHPLGAFSLWCGRQDSNLHAFAEEPKSTESTNSTTPAVTCLF